MRERKPQQSTLSIRVPDSLRDWLEGVRVVLSNGGSAELSTSDAVKVLLESVMGDRLDHRFEAADLQRDVTGSLSVIRQKWELDRDLTHAEWLLLAQFVQFGCEEPCANPDLPGNESLAQLILAFLAVRAMRSDSGFGLDRYYLGNLGYGMNVRQIGPELVPELADKLIEQLRQTVPSGKRPVFAGRNLYVALRDERLPGIAVLNTALKPFLAALFRLAARGHWLRMRRPIGPEFGTPIGHASVKTLEVDNTRLDVVVHAGEVRIIIDLCRKNLTYSLDNYPAIREFATMLERLQPGSRWDGNEFLGETVSVGTDAERFCFCNRRSGTKIMFRFEEWRTLTVLFGEALGLTEIQPVLRYLSNAYGEV